MSFCIYIHLWHIWFTLGNTSATLMANLAAFTHCWFSHTILSGLGSVTGTISIIIYTFWGSLLAHIWSINTVYSNWL
jgi:hypothetical protein